VESPCDILKESEARKACEADPQAIEGERIVCQARKTWSLPLARTGGHRIQRSVLRGNATCVVERGPK